MAAAAYQPMGITDSHTPLDTYANNPFKALQSRYARSLEAEDQLLQGRAEDARDLLEPLYDPAESSGDAAMLAWAYANVGQLDRAAEVLESFVTRATAQGNVLELVDGWRVQAMLQVRLHRYRDASAILDEVIARCQTMPYPYAEAKALNVYGLMEGERRQPEQARERFRAALAILNRLGERLYAEQVERALAQLA